MVAACSCPSYLSCFPFIPTLLAPYSSSTRAPTLPLPDYQFHVPRHPPCFSIYFILPEFTPFLPQYSNRFYFPYSTAFSHPPHSFDSHLINCGFSLFRPPAFLVFLHRLFLFFHAALPHFRPSLVFLYPRCSSSFPPHTSQTILIFHPSLLNLFHLHPCYGVQACIVYLEQHFMIIVCDRYFIHIW